MIRVGGPTDHEAAVEVWRAARAAVGIRPSADRVARVREKLAQEQLVVFDDGGVVGMTVGEQGRDDPELLHVSMMFVHPDAWRRGIGSALLEGIADLAWPLGARRLQVWTKVTNTPAQALYEACGLERTGDVHDGIERWAGELEPPVEAVVVTSEGIRLGQLLKLAELVETGAEGKELLAAGGVQVNGEVELRRGRQMEEGDLVQARDRSVQVLLG